MKKFIGRLLCFLTLFGLVYFLTAEYIYISYNYLSKQFSFSHVLDRIGRSEQIIHSDTLYIGDSVAEQLFSFYQNKNSLTINGSVLMSGQYILLKNVLKHNKIKHIYLIISPTSLGQDFSDPRVFNNFVKPFYTIKYQSNISPLVYNALNTQPLSHLFILSGFKFLPISDLKFFEGKHLPKKLLSEINEEYLNKIIALAKKENISLHLVATPAPDIYQNLYDTLELAINPNHVLLKESMIEYKKSIRYLPIAAFRDSLHLSKESLSTNIEEYKKWIITQH